MNLNDPIETVLTIGRDGASVLRSLRGQLDLGLLERETVSLAQELPDHPVQDRWEAMQGQGSDRP